MTDEPSKPSSKPVMPPSGGSPTGPGPANGTMTGAGPDRARVVTPPARKLDALPLLYLVGFVVLAGALFYIWRNPATPRGAVQDAAQVTTLQQQVAALANRLGTLEARPVPDPAPLVARLAEVEKRPVAAPVDVAPLEQRLAALEGRAPPDVSAIQQKLDQGAAKAAEDGAALAKRVDDAVAQAAAQGTAANQAAQAAVQAAGQQAVQAAGAKVEEQGRASQAKLDQFEARVAAVEASAKQALSGMQAIANRSQLATRLQAAAGALEAGQALGDIPNAPPALARFASQAPPTMPVLRQRFEAAAEAARRASQPALTDGQSLGTRMWVRAQQAVTVRQGENVILGDPISGTIAAARSRLEIGDLAGAVKALDGLQGPARAAMEEWVGQARGVMDARAALSDLAGRS